MHHKTLHNLPSGDMPRLKNKSAWLLCRYGQGIPGVSPVIQEADGSSRVHLTIVGPQVGAVLGRNGTNISQIRQVSGHFIRHMTGDVVG